MSEMTISPGMRSGCASPPSSKSELHRFLIASALSAGEVEIETRGLSEDVEATIDCLDALGASIEVEKSGRGETISVSPISEGEERSKKSAVSVSLPCRESGSTLRFLLPVAGLLGKHVVFIREGRLPERPLSPYLEALSSGGMRFASEGRLLYAEGKLLPGRYVLPGDVSSQYITGLLFALPFLGGDSEIVVKGKIESGDYIRMTEHALKSGGILIERKEKNGSLVFSIPGNQVCAYPRRMKAGGDWSGAAFFLAMGALSEKGVTVKGLSLSTGQGDRAITRVLQSFGAVVKEEEDGVTVSKDRLRGIGIDASSIPDLVPVLAVVASLAEGETRIFGAGRLRMKESDRLKTTSAMLNALGGEVEETDDGLWIRGKKTLCGGRVDSAGDHRIAMSAAVAASGSLRKVVIEGAEAVKKSFPSFFTELDKLKRL